jgi:hypothetical protein
MIHFDFTLEDADAENLFSALRAMVVAAKTELLREEVQANAHLKAAYLEDALYWEALLYKLGNKRVY